uniref:kelch-like protein 1 n=1 Tax=Styela clava TaxID=7725 RepID=UPI00193A4F73|nr:kelch-like protein 1 [Styela clava]
MEKAVKRDKFCDFRIIVGQTTIPVHRWVLDFHSEYFRAMFENDFLESKQGFCKTNGVTEEGVKSCIDFMYGDELNIDMDNVSNVLQVSHMWQLDKATEICSEFLKKHLTLSLCIGIKKIASLYDLNEIEKDCYKLISQNLSEILFCKDIGDLNKDDIIKIIDQVDEADAEKLWAFCCTWARKQTEEESISICVVLHSFPASHFTISQFEDFIWHNEHVLSCDNCKQQLAYTFLFNAVDKEEYQFEINTCLFVKELAKKYSVDKVMERVDNFIATHFREIILQENFMEIPKDDVILYMTKIDEKI